MTSPHALAIGFVLAGGVAAADPPPPACMPPRAASCSPHAMRKDPGATRRDPVLLPPVLTLVNLHTHEAMAVDARVPAASEPQDLERLLRDRTSWETHAIAPECVATIRTACAGLGAQRVELVSGFRSDKLNEMLRKKGHHVARHSQHVLGRAVDFRLPAVPYAELYSFVRRNHPGGVGAYPESRFVHVDAGPARRWNGE